MPTATCRWYSEFFRKAMGKELDIFPSGVDALTAVLLKSTYTPDQASHAYASALSTSTNEPTGGGYSRQTATGAALTQATNIVQFDIDDLSFGPLTLADVRWCVLYDDTPSGATAKPLICYWDFGSTLSPSGQTLSIAMPAGGPLKITVATS